MKRQFKSHHTPTQPTEHDQILHDIVSYHHIICKIYIASIIFYKTMGALYAHMQCALCVCAL